MEQRQIDQIRAFNRFYTKILGVLNRHYMGSIFGLPEIRVIQDIYLHPDRGAKEIALGLNMDKGYLSRLLKKLEDQGYIKRSTSGVDGRRDIISLTEMGLLTYHQLNKSADKSVEEIYGGLSASQVLKLVSHMVEIKNILTCNTDEIKHMEIIQYRDEFKEEAINLILDIQNNEAKVNMPLSGQPDLLSITDDYINGGGNFWLAIADGQVVGTLGLMKINDEWSVLKKFFVRSDYRSKKVGLALYERLFRFAAERNVKHIVLDTPSVATKAHKFYERAGFRRITKSELEIQYDYLDRDSFIYLLDL